MHPFNQDKFTSEQGWVLREPFAIQMSLGPVQSSEPELLMEQESQSSCCSHRQRRVSFFQPSDADEYSYSRLRYSVLPLKAEPVLTTGPTNCLPAAKQTAK